MDILASSSQAGGPATDLIGLPTSGGSAVPDARSETALACVSPSNESMDLVVDDPVPGPSGITRDTARQMTPDARVDLTSEASYRCGPHLPEEIADAEVSDSEDFEAARQRRARIIATNPTAAKYLKELTAPSALRPGPKSAKTRGGRSKKGAKTTPVVVLERTPRPPVRAKRSSRTRRQQSPVPVASNDDSDWETARRKRKRRRRSRNALPEIDGDVDDRESLSSGAVEDLPATSLTAKAFKDLAALEHLCNISENLQGGVRGRMRRLIEAVQVIVSKLSERASEAFTSPAFVQSSVERALASANEVEVQRLERENASLKANIQRLEQDNDAMVGRLAAMEQRVASLSASVRRYEERAEPAVALPPRVRTTTTVTQTAVPSGPGVVSVQTIPQGTLRVELPRVSRGELHAFPAVRPPVQGQRRTLPDAPVTAPPGNPLPRPVAAPLHDSVRLALERAVQQQREAHATIQAIRSGQFPPLAPPSTRAGRRQRRSAPAAGADSYSGAPVPTQSWAQVASAPPAPRPARGVTTGAAARPVRSTERSAARGGARAPPQARPASAGRARSRSATSRRGRKRRRKRKTAVVAIRAVPGQETAVSYSDVLRKAQARVSLPELGITDTRVRRDVGGGLLVEVPGPEGEALASRLAAALSHHLSEEGVTITCPVPMGEVLVSELDMSVHQQDIVDAVCRGDFGLCVPTSVRVGSLREGRGRLYTAWVRCPESVALSLASAGRLRVGWTSACVALLPNRKLQCFRCLEFGHVRATCQNTEDRSHLCFRCGEVGHRARDCTGKVHCVLCAARSLPTGHRTSGPAYLSQKKGRNGPFLQPGRGPALPVTGAPVPMDTDGPGSHTCAGQSQP